jgi:ketosteroid isomerase-like protein
MQISRLIPKGLVLALLMFGGSSMVGCGRSSGPGEVQSSQAEKATVNQPQTASAPAPATPKAPTLQELTADPQKCVAAFLEAIRQGDDERILQLYTTKARAEASSLGEHFAPKGSDTARFEVGKVEYLDANSARVSAIWTDLDENGQPQSDEAIWMVRKEEGGWRVAAMAVKVFEGDEYLFLDFEDLNRTKAMIEEFRQEQLRRAAEVASQPSEESSQVR